MLKQQEAHFWRIPHHLLPQIIHGINMVGLFAHLYSAYGRASLQEESIHVSPNFAYRPLPTANYKILE